MKTILKQIKNEWNSNLFLFVELLLVFEKELLQLTQNTEQNW